MNQRRSLRDLRRHDAHMLIFKELCLLAALALLALCALRARAAEPLTAAAVMQRGEERLRALQDYECLVDAESRLGNRVDPGTCQFWFKQPRMLRLKVLRGSRKGSEVAVDSRGQVRGSKGGILGLVVRRMKNTDARLLTLHGSSMLGLDWGSFFLKYHAAALRPTAEVTLAPHQDPSAPYQVQVSYPDGGKRVREAYSLDPERWLIVEAELDEDGVRVEHVAFRQIQLDTGVADGWFRL